MNRRKFIYYLTASSFTFGSIIIFGRNKNNKLILTRDQNLIVNNFNKLRIDRLKNDFLIELKKDLYENRTIWIGKKLYTYAELYIN